MFGKDEPISLIQTTQLGNKWIPIGCLVTICCKDLSVCCFEVFFLSFPILSRKNSMIKHASLSTSVEKTNGCDRFMISGMDNLDFDRRYGYGTVMNENEGRLDCVNGFKIRTV